MAALYCPKCGKKHLVVDRYCQYCGEDLENVILRLKRKNLPIKYQEEPIPQNGGEVLQAEKEISEYIETEKELEKFDVLPENLGNQKLSNTYSQSIQVSSIGQPSTKNQKIKLKRKKDSWWENLLWFCC